MSGTQAAPLPPLAHSATERALQGALAFALALLGFFLPSSTAGTSIALGLLLLLAIPFAPRIARQPWSAEPVLGIGMLLLAYIALRTLAEGPAATGLSEVNRYHELLMVPLVWALLRIARAPRALLLGLVAGALWFAALHWLAPLSPRLGAFIASRRISAGFGLSVCAFLLFEHARLGALPRVAAYAGAAFLVFTVLFATEGRTGHLVLLLLLACAAWRAAPRRWRWPALVAALAAVLALATLSPGIRGRVAETVHALDTQQQPAIGAPDATRIRLHLLPNAITVARDHWLVGTGWAGYPAAYRDVAEAGTGPAPAGAPWLHTDNPHNEYLMQLGAGGLPALLLFLAWLAFPLVRVRAQRHRGDPWAGALACLALAFALGCVFNSLLLDFTEGHLYAGALAWLLARRETA
ncbi:MAG: O-antigen ligase family protein [Pseudomonadota bacterium]